MIVTTITSLKPCRAWKVKAVIIYNLRKKIVPNSGKPTYIKTIVGEYFNCGFKNAWGYWPDKEIEVLLK